MANYDFSQHDLEFPRSQRSAPDSSIVLPPSFISIPNIHNFRHLGEHISASGSKTRRDLVYRSAEPSPITASGIAALQDLGITTIYDLRSLSEIERNKAQTPITDIPGTTRVFVPVFGPATTVDHERRMRYYGEVGTGGFVKAYMEILEEGRDAYRAIFTHIRDRPTEPLLVHCTAGKDRTGVLVALALGLVGVEDQEVASEYALTEIGLKEWAPTIVEHLLRDPALRRDRESVVRMVSAKKENCLAFLEKLKSDWEGPEGYLRIGLGFGDEDVQKIKQNLVQRR